jgi:hypothetical protein
MLLLSGPVLDTHTIPSASCMTACKALGSLSRPHRQVLVGMPGRMVQDPPPLMLGPLQQYPTINVHVRIKGIGIVPGAFSSL